MNVLKGVGVAMVTPFKADQSIDYTSLENLIEHFITCKTDYLVALGTTAETATLSSEEKIDILQFIIEKAGGRLPIVVGIGSNNTNEVIKCLETYPLDGVAAILSVCPYYTKPTQNGIYQHYAAIAGSTAKNILLYNVPGRTVVNISADTTLRLAKDFNNIIGIKEASGNMIQCMHLIKDRPEGFLLISGDDHVAFPLIACGFDGVISVAANSFAYDFNRLVHAALKNDFEKARELQNKLLVSIDLLFAENNPTGVKAFLAAQGYIKNVLRLPMVPASDMLMEKIKIELSENMVS